MGVVVLLLWWGAGGGFYYPEVPTSPYMHIAKNPLRKSKPPFGTRFRPPLPGPPPTIQPPIKDRTTTPLEIEIKVSLCIYKYMCIDIYVYI